MAMPTPDGGDAHAEEPDGDGEGPPAEFTPLPSKGGFAERIGPFFVRESGDDGRTYGFRPTERHCNAQDIVHGGAYYSFADHIAGHNIVLSTGRMCATAKLKVEFMAPAPVGGWVEARCRIVRATRGFAFVRITLSSGTRTVMTADGSYRLFGEWSPAVHGATPAAGGASAEPVPGGFKAFSLQGGFPELYGPMRYNRDGDGRYVCGLATHAGHDNTTGAVHGGVILAFADDMMGRTVSASTRRYSSTIALDVSYLDSVAPGAWLEGRAEISGADDELCFVRATVQHAGRPVLSADGVWRLFGGYGA